MKKSWHTPWEVTLERSYEAAQAEVKRMAARARRAMHELLPQPSGTITYRRSLPSLFVLSGVPNGDVMFTPGGAPKWEYSLSSPVQGRIRFRSATRPSWLQRQVQRLALGIHWGPA